MAGSTNFVSQLGRGPAFLLLGQNYLRLEAGSDPLLREIGRKLDRDPAPTSYLDLLGEEIPMTREAWLAWLDERCRRIVPPRWLEIVAEYAWSGFYTTAIDSVWPRVLRRPWRELQPLFEEKFRPSDPRNRRVLHCTHLYGSVNRVEDHERPPTSRFEWSRRSQIATALARRLPELVTPVGTLVIEGYAGDGDFFPPEQLMPVLADFGPSQVHFFSVTEQLAQEPYVAELVRAGNVVLHQESLADVLGKASREGTLQLGPRDERDRHAHRIELAEGTLEVPRELWNRVARSAIVVDDTVLAQPPALSPDARYMAFRDFLSTAEGEPNWAAFTRGFAFRRQFEEDLEELVRQRLGRQGQDEEPVIVHGQTGSGKTVALGVLAYNLRRERVAPVLFIDRRSQRPVPADVDAFCRWCEDGGASTTLIVWDGMVDPDEYAQFLRYLTSRGRRVVLVGSTYRQTGELSTFPNLVLAPGDLSSEEASAFRSFLEDVDESLGEIAEAMTALEDDTFLVALYRLLPSTRSAVRHGVTREMEYAEAALARRAGEGDEMYVPTTALGAALVAAGLVDQGGLSSEPTRVVEGERIDDFMDLTNLVMVPGRFGLHVPLELLLRALGHGGYANFLSLLEGVDIVRWFEDSAGNIELGPRGALEARLLVQSRLGGAPAEIAYVRRLLLEVTESRVVPGANREAAFAADLLQAFGPRSPERGYFSAYFRELADALRQLRDERGIENPGLMLAEANLRREWATDYLDRPFADVDAAEEALQEALEILHEALLAIPPGSDRDRRLRANLLVERAATLGVQCYRLLEQGSPDRAIRLFDDLRTTVLEARQENPGSYYPIDVLAWVTRDMLKSEGLSEVERAEAIADMLYAFGTAEIQDFDYEQIERFHRRRMELGLLISDVELSDDAFNRLKEQGSTAGFYLRALTIAGRPIEAATPTSEERRRACEAVEYLEEQRRELVDDPRALTLLLQLWWVCRTGERLFESDRFAPSLEEPDWRTLLHLVRQVEATGRATRAIDLAYLRGLCLFHLNILGEAFAVFRDEVERASYAIRSRRRLIRAYVASNPDGSPRVFHGTIQWLSSDGRKGEVYVEELRRAVPIQTREFNLGDAERGRSLGDFHIAFNYLGPIAEPIHFYRASRRRGRGE